MGSEEEMTEEILTKVAALADGELPESEREEIRTLVSGSPELVSHLAFLERLREATFAESEIRMPAGLSERIAAATYARPTLWSKFAAAFAPTPARYAFGGLALSGVAAICWFALKPSTVILPTPVASPAPDRVAIEPTPAPSLPRQKTVAPTPGSVEKPIVVAAISKTPPISLPTPEPTFVVPTPDFSARPTQPKKNGLASTPKSVASTPAPERPVAAPKKLAPAKFVEPTEGELVVADASDSLSASSTSGEIKAPGESAPLTAQPRSVTIGSTDAAARLDPAELPRVENVKITVANLPLEKGTALAGKATAGAQGSRMSLVNDGVRN